MAFKRGHIPWNRGLTKETDIRVNKSAIKLKETLQKTNRIGYWKNKKRPDISKRMSGENNPSTKFENRKKIKENHADVSEKKNPRYKHGLYCEQHYCIGCAKEISPRATRCKECSIIYINKTKIRFGKNASNWKGGISFEPYPIEFNSILKECIRDRDNRKCQLCNKSEEENGEKLSVHHIDYDKENLNENNLISLCRKCNAKVNTSRDYYYAYFRDIMEGK